MDIAPDTGPAPHDRLRRVRIAWIVALVADVVQWVAMPLFMAGGASPFDLALEAVVSLVMFRLLGWHPVLLPALLSELIPGMDLVPAWTIAVWIATRGKSGRVDRPPLAPPPSA